MVYSVVENWANNTIANALIETKGSRDGSFLAFAILEMGVELVSTNVAPFEYAARGVAHIVLSPFVQNCKVLTGINYLLHAIYKTAVAVLFDHFVILIAVFRLCSLRGQHTEPMFTAPAERYKSIMAHAY